MPPLMPMPPLILRDPVIPCEDKSWLILIFLIINQTKFLLDYDVNDW